MAVKTSLLENDAVFDDLESPELTVLLEHVADLSMVVNDDGEIAQMSVPSAELRADIARVVAGTTRELNNCQRYAFGFPPI